MVGYTILAFLGAFGLLCLFWTMFGWLLPACREGWLLYPGRPGELTFVQIYLWLRSLGIVTSRLVLLDLGLEETQRRTLRDRGIEIYAAEELSSRLGIGAEET